MIDAKKFLQLFSSLGVENIFGVPDSLLKNFSAEMEAKSRSMPASSHRIVANEGSAVACAVGSYLTCGRPALVYMQNSGLGNAINPLASIAAREVYGVPMVLLIGWRGRPGETDEPQHMKQGEITPELLDLLGIPWTILPANQEEAETVVTAFVARTVAERNPVALLVAKNTFESRTFEPTALEGAEMTRESALRCVSSHLAEETLVIATTGMLGRELHEIRNESEVRHTDFLNIGGMGHAISIALGAVIGDPKKRVACLDGDGSLLMHLGSLFLAGKRENKNLTHIVFNNGVHDSVGGQPTPLQNVSLAEIARAAGYPFIDSARTPAQIARSLEAMSHNTGPWFLEILVRPGNRADLGRPKGEPFQMLTELQAQLAR